MITYYGYNSNLSAIPWEFDIAPVISEDANSQLATNPEIATQDAQIAPNYFLHPEAHHIVEEPVFSLEAIIKTLDFVENSDKNPNAESKFAHLFEKEESKTLELKTEGVM